MNQTTYYPRFMAKGVAVLQVKPQQTRCRLMELPTELRLGILEYALRSQLDFDLAIPLDAPERADSAMQKNRRCFGLGIFHVNTKIRAEAIPILLRHCQLIVKEQMTLANLQRWVAAGNTGLRLEDHTRHLWIRWHATIMIQYEFTEFLKRCKKLESLRIEFGGPKFYPWRIDGHCPCGGSVGLSTWAKLQWWLKGYNPLGNSSVDHKEWSFPTQGWRFGLCHRLRQLGTYIPRQMLEELRALRGLQTVDVLGPAYWPSKFWQQKLTEWLREAMCQPKKVADPEPAEAQAAVEEDVEMTDYFLESSQTLT